MKFLTLAPFVALASAMPTFTGNPESPGFIFSRGDAPPANGVKVRGITYGGTGCPQGTATITVDSTGTLFTILFDTYVVSIGPDKDITENRKVCTINADILYPSGYQYSIFSVDTQGYLNIEKGVTATVRSAYYFSGESAKQKVFEVAVKGPKEVDYVKVDSIPVTSEVWSPCGEEGLMNAATQLRLTTTDKKAKGLLTTDSLSGKFKLVAAVQWQKCTKP